MESTRKMVVLKSRQTWNKSMFFRTWPGTLLSLIDFILHQNSHKKSTKYKYFFIQVPASIYFLSTEKSLMNWLTPSWIKEYHEHTSRGGIGFTSKDQASWNFRIVNFKETRWNVYFDYKIDILAGSGSRGCWQRTNGRVGWMPGAFSIAHD